MSDPFPVVFDPAYGMRAEFGELARQSGRMLNARHHAQITGASHRLPIR